MNPPTWKKWLSYLVDLHLESASSDFNEELQVFLVKGRYQLVTQNAVYSFDDLYTNFRDAFTELNIGEKAIEKVLLLGLGLGSIPFMLENKFDLDADYTAVEIDEAIIYLANKYTLSEIQAPINYICTDAANFVQICQDKFDLICMDVFKDDFIPEEFETLEYLETLKDLLNPNGMLLYNRLASFKKDIEASQKFKEEKFLQVFPNAYHLNVKGNWMLVGKK